MVYLVLLDWEKDGAHGEIGERMEGERRGLNVLISILRRWNP
jgi:hypothetical protein